ncbi:FAD-binding oxidoreductase [Stygiolobus caldivivus]|uniref:FAD binding domain-containing protein n=1 Tax=Stygiolobus caldivivus TaxID=2824673 RepID=A0A8D5UAD9_9CREN|nr:FAD-binding protein [Stygiolobus caldivivus]BCU71574.1 FAD binding domain-containing protein [Stygiolobus caldivivus]
MLSQIFLSKLKEIDYSIDPKIVSSLSRDFSHTSPIISPLLSKSANAVVFPKNEDEVKTIVEACIEEHVPIVPRGGGVNNVGGVIPMKGGIIMDLSRMKTFKEYEDEIEVGPGVSFCDNGRLRFNVRVYPSTYCEGATVAGFFSGGSGGIGEFRYGRNWDYATEVTMVNPVGKTVKLRGGDVKIAAHAEGTTGIITKLKVQKREKTKDIPIVVEFDNLHNAMNFIQSLYDNYSHTVYHVTLRSPEMSRLTSNITGYYTSKWNVLVVCEEECPFKGKRGDGVWEKRFLFFGGTITTAMGIMKKRYYYVVKDIPLEETEEKLTKVIESRKGFVTDVEFDIGRKSHPFILTDEEKEYYEILKILGGTNFDLNSIYINSRLPRDHLHKILVYKKMYDKEDLFNPDKVKF